MVVSQTTKWYSRIIRVHVNNHTGFRLGVWIFTLGIKSYRLIVVAINESFSMIIKHIHNLHLICKPMIKHIMHIIESRPNN